MTRHRGRGGVGARDGRSVAQPVRALEQAGLVQRTRGKRVLWYPTQSGREVDRILDEITYARGGQFRPLLQAGIVWRETYALRHS